MLVGEFKHKIFGGEAIATTVKVFSEKIREEYELSKTAGGGKASTWKVQFEEAKLESQLETRIEMV